MIDTCPHHSGIEAELKKLCALMDERQKQSDIRFSFIKESIKLAKEEMDRRLEEMNQFRAQLTAQANTFATRSELKVEAEKLDLKLGPLLKSDSSRVGASTWSDKLILVIISAIVSGLVAFIMVHGK